VIDDPHSEQAVLSGDNDTFDKAYDWYTYGARTRLMPGGAVAVVATRWSKVDLIGRVVKDGAMRPEADQFEVFEFPAILNENTPEEKALWGEVITLEALKRTRASMPVFQWNAQYQQNPTGESASVIKREDWNVWEDEEPPECEYLIMALDAAAEMNNRADFTAIQTWGVFFNTKTERHELIMLNAIKKRVEFPELKKLAKEQYDEWKPDAFIVEKKSSGVALYQELRRTGMIISEYTPTRGTVNNPNNKMVRLNAVADIARAGLIWAPQTRWADDVIEEVASFPFGDHDDQLDVMVMVLARFRQGGFLVLPSDMQDEESYFKPRRKEYY
jgi:predicted phage terminase large subunit-like protein